MSKSVSRRSRHRIARKGGLGDLVAANMLGPKPGRSLERSHCAPNALGAKSARFNDPAGNTFKARYEPGSRPNYKHDERHLAYSAKLSLAFEAAVVAYRKRRSV